MKRFKSAKAEFLKGKKYHEVNTLTYRAKRQIKYLHETDSETWTVEKIATNFPVSPMGAEAVRRSEEMVNSVCFICTRIF